MTYEYEQYLAHHGIKGQKWGNRRYQNEDGSLTEAGKQRYGHLTENVRKTSELANKAFRAAEGHGYLHPSHDMADIAYKRVSKAVKKQNKFEKKLDLNKYVDNKYGKDKVDSYLKNAEKTNEAFNKYKDRYIKKYGDTPIGNIFESFDKTPRGKAYAKKVDGFLNEVLNDSLSTRWLFDEEQRKKRG